MTENEDLKKAKERVENKKWFYVHLIVFCLGSALLFALNMINSPGRIWFIYPVIGWAVGGLLTHFLTVFGLPTFGILNKKWEEREIEFELDKIRRERAIESFFEEEESLDLNSEKEKSTQRLNEISQNKS